MKDVRVAWLVLAILMCSWSMASAQDFEIEPWEKRLNARQPPEKVMDAIALGPGMVVGEVGAGSGRMTVWLTDRVGPQGRIYANDIDEDALAKLARRCEKAGIGNVEVILGEVLDPKLPAGILDMVFMINVYHHLDDPVELLRNARVGLKPDGTLAIVECDPDKTDWGGDHGCVGKAEMTRQLAEAGFEMIRIESFLNEDQIYVARNKP